MSKTKTRSEQLEGAVKVANKNKQEAIEAATQPLGFCLFIAIFILIVAIAPPIGLVLL